MTTLDVTIIDYGLGNLLSVRRGFEHFGVPVTVTSDPKVILNANRLVLPGVGAFPNAMTLLKKHNLIEAIMQFATLERPMLAICLGMQLLMEESEEFALTPGLGLVPGRVVPIPNENPQGLKVKVPHIGWNALIASNPDTVWIDTVLEENSPGDEVYFVHSFMVVPTEAAHEIAVVNYGGHRISSVITRNQFTGCQFHPEKSGELGLKLLKRFCYV